MSIDHGSQETTYSTGVPQDLHEQNNGANGPVLVPEARSNPDPDFEIIRGTIADVLGTPAVAAASAEERPPDFGFDQLRRDPQESADQRGFFSTLRRRAGVIVGGLALIAGVTVGAFLTGTASANHDTHNDASGPPTATAGQNAGPNAAPALVPSSQSSPETTATDSINAPTTLEGSTEAPVNIVAGRIAVPGADTIPIMLNHTPAVLPPILRPDSFYGDNNSKIYTVNDTGNAVLQYIEALSSTSPYSPDFQTILENLTPDQATADQLRTAVVNFQKKYPGASIVFFDTPDDPVKFGIGLRGNQSVLDIESGTLFCRVINNSLAGNTIGNTSFNSTQDAVAFKFAFPYSTATGGGGYTYAVPGGLLLQEDGSNKITASHALWLSELNVNENVPN